MKHLNIYMDSNNRISMYNLTRVDKIIFFVYVLLTSTLFLIQGPSLQYFIQLLVLSGSSVLCVYFFVFVALKKLMPFQQYGKIVFWGIIIFLGLVAFDLLFYMGIYPWVWDEDPTITTAGVINVLLNHIVFGISLLGLVMIKKNFGYQITLLKMENTRKTNELRFLKAQIDPHFLFNNLNTLDALMDTNPQKAKMYIHRLAHLYQYLLTNKDEETITLAQELDFVKDYCYLLNERFGDIYQYHFITQNDYSKNKLIPPGAIQTVLENVVKHNIGTINEPIIVTIEVLDSSIIVKNNIRLNRQYKPSFGIGLKNLRAQYELLSEKTISVTQDKDYSIRLPLLDNYQD